MAVPSGTASAWPWASLLSCGPLRSAAGEGALDVGVALIHEVAQQRLGGELVVSAGDVVAQVGAAASVALGAEQGLDQGHVVDAVETALSDGAGQRRRGPAGRGRWERWPRPFRPFRRRPQRQPPMAAIIVHASENDS